MFQLHKMTTKQLTYTRSGSGRHNRGPDNQDGDSADNNIDEVNYSQIPHNISDLCIMDRLVSLNQHNASVSFLDTSHNSIFSIISSQQFPTKSPTTTRQSAGAASPGPAHSTPNNPTSTELVTTANVNGNGVVTKLDDDEHSEHDDEIILPSTEITMVTLNDSIILLANSLKDLRRDMVSSQTLHDTKIENLETRLLTNNDK